MPPFKVPDSPFAIERVMAEIKTQIVDAAETAPDAADPKNTETTRPIVSDGGFQSWCDSMMGVLQERQSLDPGYRVHSHRRVIGPILDLIKRVIHWGSHPYTDAVRLRQEAFNNAVLEVLRNGVVKHQRSVDEAIAEHWQRVIRLEAAYPRLAALESEVETLFDRHAFYQHPFFRRIADSERSDALDASRGLYEAIKDRQYQYLTMFDGAPGPILDVGCGRGEMLNMLRIHGLECWGADVDPYMVEAVRKLGVHCVETDALSALRSAEDASLGGIFAAQIVEHFFPGELLSFLQLAREKMAPGARLLIETVNPESLVVLSKSYFRDMDHKMPVNPNTLVELLEMAGFEKIERHDLSPFTEAERLADLPDAETLGLDAPARDAAQAIVARLNAVLYGPQDYYVTAIQSEPWGRDEGEGRAKT